MVETSPDITFFTSVASKFAKNPGHIHTKAVKRILKYLKETKECGIVYGRVGADVDNLIIEGYSDSDWAGDKMKIHFGVHLYVKWRPNQLVP